MILSFINKDMPGHAFALYNFGQVSDAVLLVTVSQEQKLKKILLNFIDDKWQPNDNSAFMDAKSFDALSQQLTNVFELNRQAIQVANKHTAQPVMESHNKILPDHILMLSNLCS